MLRRIWHNSLLPRWRAWIKSDRSILGWAILTGFLAGILAVTLKRAVAFLHGGMFTIQSALEINWWLGFGPILGLLATRWVVRNWLAGDHPGPGVPSILQALSQRRGRIRRTWMYAPLVTSALSVGLGGSGGLEAPSLQAAAAVGSEIGRQTKRNFKRRMLLIGCAAAASLAALFQAPIAAIIFAVEVIMIDLTAASLVPLLLASLTALLTANFWIGSGDILVTPDLVPFELSRLPMYALLGVVCAIGSVVFSKIYLWSNHTIARMRAPRLRILIAGIILGLSVVIFPALYGEGYDIVNDLFEGHASLLTSSLPLPWESKGWGVIVFLVLAWVLKPFLTGMTVGAGGVAGIFAPAIFCGAILGHAYATAMGMLVSESVIPIGNAVLAGIGGMLAGVLHAPLTAILLAAEVSGGYALFVPVMLTSALSYQGARWWMRHSVYTRELAERGELLTHDKDRSVLTLMKLLHEVERDHEAINPQWTLGQLIPIIQRSTHSLFPVIDHQGRLLGLIDLQDIREVMFDSETYDSCRVQDLMTVPASTIDVETKMSVVMGEFERTGAWFLPVLESGRFVGFVSRSKLFDTYRKWLREASLD